MTEMPPHDLVAEAAAVGAALCDGGPAVALLAEAGLRRSHLFDPASGHIWDACQALHADGKPVDLVTVHGWLQDRGRLREVGGVPGLARVIDASPSLAPDALREYACRLILLAQERHLRAGLQVVAAQLAAGEGDPAWRLGQVRAKLAELGGLTETASRAIPVRDISDFAGEEPAVAWVCRGVHLAPGRPFCLVGYAGSGKTWLAADVALAASDPLPGATAFGGLPIDRQGQVVYLDGEVGTGTTWRRFRRLAAGRGRRIEEWSGRLSYAIYPRFNLLQPDAEARLAATCEGKVLCVFDSLKRLLAGADMNDAGVSDPLSILARVSEKTGCAFLIIHHEGKPPADGTKEARFRGRGSSGIQDELGSQWALSPLDGGVMRLEHGKSEHGQRCPSRHVKLEDVGPVCPERGYAPGVRIAVPADPAEPQDGPVEFEVTVSGLERAKRTILNFLGVEGETRSGKLKEALKNINNGTYSRAMRELQADGRVVRHEQKGGGKSFSLPVSTETSSQRSSQPPGMKSSVTSSQSPSRGWDGLLSDEGDEA